MGYQESYFVPKKEIYFEDICDEIKEKGKEYFEQMFCYPVEIITFTKNHAPFRKGQKAIYFTGERYPQRHYTEEIIPKNWDKCHVYFTEEVNPTGVWPDATDGNEYDVVMERFSFN